MARNPRCTVRSPFVTIADKGDLDQALGAGDGELAEQQGVDESEDADIRTDAKGERENGDGGEAGILA